MKATEEMLDYKANKYDMTPKHRNNNYSFSPTPQNFTVPQSRKYSITNVVAQPPQDLPEIVFDQRQNAANGLASHRQILDRDVKVVTSDKSLTCHERFHQNYGI